MRLIYGKNATNKSRDAQVINDRGGIVLTSRMEEWKNLQDQTFMQSNSAITRFEGDKSKRFNEAFTASSRSSLGYLGKPADLKKMLSKSGVYSSTIANIDLFNAVEDIEERIDIGTVTQQMINIETMNSLSVQIQNLTQVEFNNLLDATLFKKSVKKNIQTGDGPLMTTLMGLNNTAIGVIDNIGSELLKNIINDGDDALLNLLREGNNPGTTIVNTKIDNFLKNLKLFLGADYISIWQNLNTLKNERLIFTIPAEEIAKLEEEFGITISLSDEGRKFKYEGGIISDGQFTMLSAQMVLGSVAPETNVIFDDVLETLDDENVFTLLTKLSKYSNAEVLTHSSNMVSVVSKVSDTLGEDIQKGKKIGGSTALTWGDVLTNMKAATTSDPVKNNMKSLLKLFSRYVAKDSIIHSFADNQPISAYDSSMQHKHWMLAGKTLHYHPAIEVATLNSFFPEMTFTGATLDTISFLDKLLEWLSLNKVANPTIFGIALQRLEDFITKIRVEVIEEKRLYDTYTPIGGNDAITHFWGNPSKAYSKYADARVAASISPRNNAFVHSIDNSPLDLI